MLLKTVAFSILCQSVIGAYLEPRDGTVNSTDANCPTDTGEYYTDANGYTYLLTCSRNGNDGLGDIFNVQADGLAACAKVCSDYNLGHPSAPCTGVVANNFAASGGNHCYLKGSATYSYGDPNIFFDTAVVVSAPEPAPAIPVTYNVNCPPDDRKMYTDSDGVTYEVFCIYTISSPAAFGTLQGVADYATCAETCSDLVGTATPCNAFTFSGGNCSLFTGTITAVPSENTSDEVGILVLPANTCDITSTTTSYTLAEGGTYSQSPLYTDPDSSNGLGISLQPNACLCVEQCAYYNRMNNGTTNPPCVGATYDTDPNAGENCLITSQ